MKKRSVWQEWNLEMDGKKFVQLCDTVSLEEAMRFKALFSSRDLMLRGSKFIDVKIRM